MSAAKATVLRLRDARTGGKRADLATGLGGARRFGRRRNGTRGNCARWRYKRLLVVIVLLSISVLRLCALDFGVRMTVTSELRLISRTAIGYLNCIGMPNCTMVSWLDILQLHVEIVF